MYQGDYEQNRIILKNELDRKRIEGKKAEIILYNADYVFLNSWNKDVRETRVIKTIYDNGQVNHGVYSGVDLDDKAPNNLENINSNNDYDALYNAFWCAESEVPTNVNETPCEIYIGEECVNDKALKEWTKKYDNWIMPDKELKIKFHADIKENDIKKVKQSFQKSGADIIADNFPELKYISHFNVEVLGNSKFYKKKEIEVSFYAEVEEKEFESIERGFQKSGADIIAENFPELSNIGYFKIIDNKNDIEISDVFEDDDVLYFFITKDGRGCYQNVEPSQVEKYLEGTTDEEYEKAIYNWAVKNLDISKLPNIEDATPAMKFLYNEVSSSENNMYYLDLDNNENLGMSQEEFEKQVDSDVKKYGLEDVVVKDYDGALYACFGNLQCSFTEKVVDLNICDEKLDKNDKKNRGFGHEGG